MNSLLLQSFMKSQVKSRNRDQDAGSRGQDQPETLANYFEPKRDLVTSQDLDIQD
jgi:hypothetical protein